MRGKSHLIIGTLSALECSILLNSSLPQFNTSNLVCLGSAVFFSTFPDIDESNSNVLNRIVNKKEIKKIHSILIYLILMMIFYFYIKSNNSLYIGIALTLFIINLITKKLTSNLLRSVLMSIFIFMVGVFIYLLSSDISIAGLIFIFALLPFFGHRTLSHSALIVLLIYMVMKHIETTFSIDNLAIISAVSYASHLLCDSMTKRGIPIFYPLSKNNYNIGSIKVGSFLGNSLEYLCIISLIFIILFSVIFSK